MPGISEYVEGSWELSRSRSFPRSGSSSEGRQLTTLVLLLFGTYVSGLVPRSTL